MKPLVTGAGWLAFGVVTGVSIAGAAGLPSGIELQVNPVPFAQAAVLVLLAGTVRPQRSSRRLRAGEPVVRGANDSWGRPPFSRPHHVFPDMSALDRRVLVPERRDPAPGRKTRPSRSPSWSEHRRGASRQA